jgi:drug/metabolite transporter (DMT)-like permease
MTPGKSKTATLSEISLISATVFWGLNFAATKYAAEFVPPLVFMALRFAGGGLLLLLVCGSSNPPAGSDDGILSPWRPWAASG